MTEKRDNLILDAIKSVGFPIVVALILLYVLVTKLDNLEKKVDSLTLRVYTIEAKVDMLSGGDSK